MPMPMPMPSSPPKLAALRSKPEFEHVTLPSPPDGLLLSARVTLANAEKLRHLSCVRRQQRW
jgi:hypothetical protein